MSLKWCCTASLPALSGAVALLGAAPARAADRTCPPMVVQADAAIRARWPDVPAAIRAAFADRADVDACARVELSLAGRAIAIKVVLPDGRSAARTAPQKQDVVPTLQALLLVPRRPSPPAPVAPSAPAPPLPALPSPRTVGARDPRVPASSELVARRAPVSLPADGPARGLAVELSIAAGARFGDGQTGAGFAALSFLDISGWLLGFEARVDGYQPVAGGESARALGLALLGGRRFRFGTLALDLIGGPAVAHEGGSMSATQHAPSEPVIVMREREENAFRLRFGARLNFRARSVFRTFVGLDGDVGQSRSDVDVVINSAPGYLPGDQGRMPGWTLGLSIGATVGTL
jgi:hypothetical protein